MMTKQGLARDAVSEASVLPLLEKYLSEIKAIRKEIAAKRTAGRKTSARIDRNLKAIQANLDRVAANR